MFLIFVFFVLKHVYIPLLFFSGVDYIDAPTPYMMGLHSGVDTSLLVMDGVSSSTLQLIIFASWQAAFILLHSTVNKLILLFLSILL